jgi:hypothetical protein
MEEIKRGERVERVSDGVEMECWGLDVDRLTYRCSWYEGRDQHWGSFSRNAIRFVATAAFTTDKSTDWRKVKW